MLCMSCAKPMLSGDAIVGAPQVRGKVLWLSLWCKQIAHVYLQNERNFFDVLQ